MVRIDDGIDQALVDISRRVANESVKLINEQGGFGKFAEQDFPAILTQALNTSAEYVGKKVAVYMNLDSIQKLGGSKFTLGSLLGSLKVAFLATHPSVGEILAFQAKIRACFPAAKDVKSAITKVISKDFISGFVSKMLTSVYNSWRSADPDDQESILGEFAIRELALRSTIAEAIADVGQEIFFGLGKLKGEPESESKLDESSATDSK